MSCVSLIDLKLKSVSSFISTQVTSIYVPTYKDYFQVGFGRIILSIAISFVFIAVVVLSIERLRDIIKTKSVECAEIIEFKDDEDDVLKILRESVTEITQNIERLSMAFERLEKYSRKTTSP